MRYNSKKVSLVFLLIFIMLFLGCSHTNNNNVNSVESDKVQPKEVIENYFTNYNKKDRGAVLATFSSRKNKPNVVFGFENLLFIKLIKIEDDDMNTTDSYLQYGPGKENGVTRNNVISYKVTFASLYSKKTPPWSSGIQTIYFTLIRDSDNSPWLIDDTGV